MRAVLIFLLFTAVSGAFAQAPVILKIEPESTFPGDTIVISGNGFSATPSDLEVWFDAVKGTIVSSSDYSIEVVVPPQARLAPVQVINLTSKLAGKSLQKFMPSLPISSFAAAKFTTPLTFSSADEVWDLCSCDFNTDGKPDIATSKFKRPSPSIFPTPSDLMVLQNTTTTGTGSNPNTLAFTKIDKSNLSTLNLGFATDGIVCGDLQGDGKPEIVAARSTNNARNSIHILRNTSTTGISFATQQTFFMASGHEAARMSIRDLNKDGKPEIIATNTTNDRFYILFNKSTTTSLAFDTLSLSIKVSGGGTQKTYEADVQDFDGDDRPDILVSQFQTNDFYLLRNTSTGSISFAAPQRFTIASQYNRLVSADFNKDGKLDLVLTNTLNNRAEVFLNQTTSTTFQLSAPITLATSDDPWGVDVSDVDGDGDPDIIVSNRNKTDIIAASLRINIFINDGNATPGFTRTDITTTIPTRNIKVQDFDGDGKPDMAYTAFKDPTASDASSATHVGVIRNTNCVNPVILNPGPVTICNGQTIKLETMPVRNVTFTWKESGTVVGSNLPYHNITTPGNYTVTMTGEGGACEVTSSVLAVTSNISSAPADPVITPDGPLCSGATLNLSTASTANSYAWTGPNGFTSTVQSPTINPATIDNSGIYTLQIQVGACKSNIVEKRIEIVDMADFAITSTSNTGIACAGTAVTLSVNNLSNHSFQWKNNGSNVTGATSSTFNPTTDGSYSVFITNTDVGCTRETAPVTITFLNPPVAQYSLTPSSTGCVGQPITFTNTSTVDSRATPVYTWTYGDTQTGTSATATHTHTYSSASAFNTSLNVRYSGVSGCQSNANASITIVNPTQAVITSTAPSSCPDEEVTLSLTATFVSRTWSTTETSPTISVTPGTYSVNTVDANGCASTDDIEIIALEAPSLVVTATPAEIPLGATSQLNASGAATYLWSPAGALREGEDSTSATPVAKPLQTTTFTVTGTSDDGCVATATVEVVIEGVLGFPVAFSPNNDGQNETWDIGANSTPECTLSVFDGRGRKVFEKRGENWDGTYDGKQVPEGIYYFVYGCPDKKPVTGSVLLFR